MSDTSEVTGVRATASTAPGAHGGSGVPAPAASPKEGADGAAAGLMMTVGARSDDPPGSPDRARGEPNRGGGVSTSVWLASESGAGPARGVRRGSDRDRAGSGTSAADSWEDIEEELTPAAVLEFLQEGFVARKHGRSGEPARRFFYAMDMDKLFWNRTANNRTQAKYPGVDSSIAFQDVERIIAGRGTETMARSVKFYNQTGDVARRLDSCCMSLVTPKRTVDLELANVEQRDELVRDLAVLLEVPVETITLEEATAKHSFPRGGGGLSGDMYRLMYNKHMERFIIASIIFNIVCMALNSPVEEDMALLNTLEDLELVFSIIFTLEMTFRIVALEGPLAYLSDPWNALDGIIVAGGWVTELPIGGSFNFSAFRAFRALRVLRTIKFLHGIREVLETFGATLKMVVQAMIVYFYFLFLFAVLGIELFGEALDHRCVVAPPAGSVPLGEGVGPNPVLAQPVRFCSFAENTNLTALSFEEQYWYVTGPVDAAGVPLSAGCPATQMCAAVQAPDSGLSGFRDLGVSFTTVFRISARPPRTSFIIRGTMQAVTPVAVLYFVGIIVFVSFLVLSLFIAIVRGSYGEIERKRRLPVAEGGAPDADAAAAGPESPTGGGTAGSVGDASVAGSVRGAPPSPETALAKALLQTTPHDSLGAERAGVQDVWKSIADHNKIKPAELRARAGSWAKDHRRPAAGRSFRSLSQAIPGLGRAGPARPSVLDRSRARSGSGVAGLPSELRSASMYSMPTDEAKRAVGAGARKLHAASGAGAGAAGPVGGGSERPTESDSASGGGADGMPISSLGQSFAGAGHGHGMGPRRFTHAADFPGRERPGAAGADDVSHAPRGAEHGFAGPASGAPGGAGEHTRTYIHAHGTGLDAAPSGRDHGSRRHGAIADGAEDGSGTAVGSGDAGCEDGDSAGGSRSVFSAAGAAGAGRGAGAGRAQASGPGEALGSGTASSRARGTDGSQSGRHARSSSNGESSGADMAPAASDLGGGSGGSGESGGGSEGKAGGDDGPARGAQAGPGSAGGAFAGDESGAGTSGMAAGTGGNITASAGSGGTGSDTPMPLATGGDAGGSSPGRPRDLFVDVDGGSTSATEGEPSVAVTPRGVSVVVGASGAGSGSDGDGAGVRGDVPRVNSTSPARDRQRPGGLRVRVDGDGMEDLEAGRGASAQSGAAAARNSAMGAGADRALPLPLPAVGPGGDAQGPAQGEPASRAVPFWQPHKSKILFVLDPSGCVASIIRRLVHNPWFERVTMLAIITNTVLLAMWHDGMTDEFQAALDSAELFFTVAFTVEMCLKIVGLGGVHPYAFARGTQWNRFDGVVVLATLLDLAVGNFFGVSFSILRVFRVFRVVRVLRKNPDLVKLLEAVITSLVGLLNLLSFMTIVIIVFAILGMQLFGGEIGPLPNGQLPRATFDTFGDSMLTLFKMLAGGGTWDIFFDALVSKSGWAAPAYFTAYNVFSTYITLNFLVVIILGKFAMTDSEKLKRREEREAEMLEKQERLRAATSQRPSYAERLAALPPATADLLRRANEAARVAPSTPDSLDPALGQPGSWNRRVAQAGGGNVRPGAGVQAPSDSGAAVGAARAVSSAMASSRSLGSNRSSRWSFNRGHAGHTGAVPGAGGLWLLCPVLQRRWVACGGADSWAHIENRVREDKTLMLFGPDNPVRVHASKLIKLWAFEWFIIACIVVSSVTLTLESPQYESDELSALLLISDTTFLIIFTAEFLIKAVANGLAFGRHPYLGDGWNRLDISVLLVTWISVAGGGSSAGRTLRVGRILRPLRMINRNEGMKVIINALLRSLPAVGYTVILLLLFFLIFGILGLNLFMGKFYLCNDSSVRFREECTGMFILDGVAMPRVWANPAYSFDNIGAASRTLLEVVALRGWVPVLNSMMDITGPGQQPARNAEPVNALYVIVFIFLGSFYMMRLFVGIIVAHFRQFSGTALLTETQQQWITMKRVMRYVKPVVAGPEHPLRLRVYRIVRSGWFEPIVTVVILAHLAVLSTQSSTQSKEWTAALNSAHWGFFVVYLIELVMRVVALGPRGFLLQDLPWSAYDLLAVVGMFLGPVLGFRRGTGVARALRFSRVVKLLTHLQGLSRLIDVLLNSLAAMANITALMSLVLFVYAVLGLQFFGSVKYGHALNPNMNFETFPQAILSLFQIVCGENWLILMRDCSVGGAACTTLESPLSNGITGDCGLPVEGPIFFFSFFILIFAVFLNLYVAAILDTYSSSAVSGGGWTLSQDHFDSFLKMWQAHDPRGKGRIAPQALSVFLYELASVGHPLSVNPANKILFHKTRMQILAADGVTSIGGLDSTFFGAADDRARPGRRPAAKPSPRRPTATAATATASRTGTGSGRTSSAGSEAAVDVAAVGGAAAAAPGVPARLNMRTSSLRVITHGIKRVVMSEQSSVRFSTVLQVLAESKVSADALELHHRVARQEVTDELVREASAVLLQRWYRIRTVSVVMARFRGLSKRGAGDGGEPDGKGAPVGPGTTERPPGFAHESRAPASMLVPVGERDSSEGDVQLTAMGGGGQ